MRVNYNEMAVAVERLKTIIGDVKNEQISALINFNKDTGNIRVSFTDGRKAVCSEVAAAFEENEDIESAIVISYKQLCNTMEMAKPLGSLQVNDVEIYLDSEKKAITFKAEKFIRQVVEGEQIMTEDGDFADAEEETIVEKVISVMKQTFGFIRVEDDRRQAILTKVDYNGLFNIDEATSEEAADAPNEWNRDELLNILGKVTSEDDMQVIMSSKNHSVSVSNMSYTVDIPNESVETSMCMGVRVAKNIMDIFKKSKADSLLILKKDGFCTICSGDKKCLFWFETEKPKQKTINVIDGYKMHEYNTIQLVVLKDAIVNIVACCSEVNDITLKVIGDLVNGAVLSIGGADSTSRRNDFKIELADACGDTDIIENNNFKVNTTTLKSMLNLCSSVYVAVEFDVDENGSSIMKVASVEKVGGVKQYDVSTFTMVVKG